MKKVWLGGKHGSVIGNYAIVDDNVYKDIIQYQWYALEVKYINSIKYYAITYINKKQIMMHRYLLNITDPKMNVDHINENGLDNRLANIRRATKSQNAANVSKRKQHIATSQYKGVSKKDENCWGALITKDYKTYYLGYFATEIDAAEAYDIAAIEMFGVYACLNFPEKDYTNIKPNRMIKKSNIGIKNIRWSEKHKRFIVTKMINTKRHTRYSKTIEDAFLKLEELNGIQS